MERRLQNDNQIKQTLISAGLILLLLSQIFFIGIKEKMHQRIPESRDTYAEAISIVISHVKYKLNGYVGYRSIYDTLIKSGFTWDNHDRGPALNEAIAKASAESNVDSQRMYYTVGDIGYVDYIGLSFKLFGQNVESFFYLYMLILFIQVAVFYMTFRKNRLIVSGLILFLLSHYIIANGLVGAGPDMWTYHNNRFLPVLGILPIVYVALLALLNQPITWKKGLGVVLQVLIFIFILRSRMSAFWMAGPLLLIGCAGILQRAGFFVKRKITLWLIAVSFVFIVGTIFIKPLILDSQYFSENNLTHHTFWHTTFLGLAVNPEIRAIYGPRDPRQSVNTVERFKEVCDDDHPEDSALKARLRVFVCKNRGIVERPLLFLRKVNEFRDDYSENDQDSARATLKWLRQHGKTEEYLYNFTPEDKVGYPRWFGQCDSKEKILQYDPINAALRPYDSKKDFKWREMDRVMGEVVKDAWAHHPGVVLKTIFIIKPLMFVVFYLDNFMKLTSFMGLILFLVTVFYLFKEFKSLPKEDLNKCVLFLIVLFVCSMIVPLTAYPAAHTISDQSVLLTMSLLAGFLYLITQHNKHAKHRRASVL